MLTKDENVKKRLELGDALIEQKDRVDRAIEEATVDYTKLEKSSEDPTNEERQVGQRLSTEAFIKRLKSILPNIHWMINPHYSDKFGLFTGWGIEARQIASGEYPWMPEWSVLEATHELLPTTSPETVLTKEGYRREIFRPGIPTMREVPSGLKEVKRGWRTILMRLILDKFITLEQAEQKFGSGNRASWASTLKMYQPQAGDFVL